MSCTDSLSALSCAATFQSSRVHDARRAGFEAKFNEAALAAGLDPGAAIGLRDEIEAAVAAATTSASGSTDRRDAVRSTVDHVLSSHGVDLDKFRSLMQPPGGPPGPGGAGGPGGTPPGGGPDRAGKSRKEEFESRFTQSAIAAGLDPDTAGSLQDELQALIDSILSESDTASDPRQAIESAICQLLTQHGVDLTTFKSEMSKVAGLSGSAVPLLDEQA